MNMVFSLRVSKISRSRLSRSARPMICLLIAIERSAPYSRTTCVLSTCTCSGVFVSSGRLMSMPFCVSGRAAMKMMRSTRSTSMSGVTFMSALACGVSALTTRSAPKCLWACAMLLPSHDLPGLTFALGDEPDVLDLRLAEVVHGGHDRAVAGVLVSLDQDHALTLVFENGLHPLRHVAL